MALFKKFFFVIVIVILLGKYTVYSGGFTTAATALQCATLCLDATLVESCPPAALFIKMVEMAKYVNDFTNPYALVFGLVKSAASPLACASCLCTLAGTLVSPV